MKIKAFALIELLLATILGMLVMLGSVGLLENMQRESANFQRRVSEDMNWVEANQHLAQFVHSSSYLDINAGALVLYDYDGNPRGRYVSIPSADAVHPENGQLEYQAYNSAGGTYTTQSIFRSVNAAFRLTGTKKNNRWVEVEIDYTQPFQNVLYLRCAVSPPPSGTWAIVIYSANNYTQNMPSAIFQTADKGYIISGMSTLPGNPGHHYVYIVRLDSSGNRLWSRKFSPNSFGSFSSMASPVITETFDASDNSDGYIIGCDWWIGSGDPQYTVSPHMCLIRLDTSGNHTWSARYYEPGLFPGNIPQSIFHSSSMATYGQQIFNKRPGLPGSAPIGYITTALKCDVPPMPSPTVVYLGCMDTNGTPQWNKGYRYDPTMNEGGIIVKQTYGASGDADGFIISGYSWRVLPSVHETYIIRTDTAGNHIWSLISQKSWSYDSIEQTFDLLGNPDGFIMAGCDYVGDDACVRKLDNNGNQLWSAKINNSIGPVIVSQTSDGGYIAGTIGYTESTDFVRLIKLAPDGSQSPEQQLGTGEFTSIRESFDANNNFNGYIISGIYWTSDDTRIGYYIMKTDSNGECPEAAGLEKGLRIITDDPAPTQITPVNTPTAPIDIKNTSSSSRAVTW